MKKKTTIKIIAAVIAVLLISNYIGLLTPPKALVIWYFEINRQDFEDIAHSLNDGATHAYSRYDASVFSVADAGIAFKIIKLFALGGYSGIEVTRRSDEYTVKFTISNLFVDKGEPYFIRYSLNEQTRII